MEYEEQDSGALFTVMTVVMLLDAVQMIQALVGDTEGPELLFTNTSNDPSVTLDDLQPLCHYRIVLYSHQRRNSSPEGY